MKITINHIVSLILLCLMLTSCSVTTNVQSMGGFDFEQVKTFSLFPRNSEFVDLQGISDYQRNRIELAIEQTMESQGYSYVDYKDADVVVSYFLVGQSITQFARYNSKVKACFVCTKTEKANYNRKVRPSSLVIDVLDSKRYRTVYRNFDSLKLKGKNNSEENQIVIQEAVVDLLADLPTQ